MADGKLLQKNLGHFVETDSANSLPGGGRIFEPPLVGFASADDPMFVEFKKESVIGPLFRLPGEWFEGAVTVISYFLPFTEAVRRSNYDGKLPSEDWMHGRFLGEKFNHAVRCFLVNELEKMGGKAVIPALHEIYRADYDNFSSNWSERHIAYAAGLGTFGLSRGLITKKGIAGRFGSAITDLKFQVSARTFSNPFQNCPYFSDQSCGACVERCPSGAITESGKDKSACHRFTRIEDHAREMRVKYNYDHSVCGKCQVDVPCEDCIP